MYFFWREFGTNILTNKSIIIPDLSFKTNDEVTLQTSRKEHLQYTQKN